MQIKGKGNNECKMHLELEMGERGINCSGRVFLEKERLLSGCLVGGGEG